MELVSILNTFIDSSINTNFLPGTLLGDKNECKAITKSFNKRTKPLPIGSVKSNIGHTELSSGLCSVVKALTAMQTGIIPANLHYFPLDTTLPGLNDGKLEVSTFIKNVKRHQVLFGLLGGHQK